jgi:hypothetical protein
MADAKNKKDDHGQAEVQKAVEAEQEQGFRGAKVDPLPNSAHSLESGPDAPTVVEQAEAARKEG